MTRPELNPSNPTCEKNMKYMNPAIHFYINQSTNTYHCFKRFTNSSFLFRNDISKNPEARVEEGNEEEDWIEHSNHIKELAFSLCVNR